MGALVQFVNTPTGRAVVVGLGFVVFLVTFVFFTSGVPLIVGFAVGLVLLLVPFGLGGPFRSDPEGREARDDASRGGGPRRRR